jgi:hypothetical protein
LSFMVEYTVGGVLDRIRRLDGIASPIQVILPPHLFATYERPFVKGFRLEMPAVPGLYPLEYTAPQEMELLSIEVGCTGYSDIDHWSFYINDQVICDTIYCKEVAQVKTLGAVKLAAGDRLRFEFNNNSGTSKVAWLDLNFAVRA